MGRAGTFVQQTAGPEGFACFMPAPLPPSPPIDFSPELQRRYEEAIHAVGRLEGIARALGEERLLPLLLRVEAVHSTRMAGFDTTLLDLLRHEADDAPVLHREGDRAAARCAGALSLGLERVRSDPYALALRLLREVHRALLRGEGEPAPGDGEAAREAGRFRRTQNWVGGTGPGDAWFVPPPPRAIAYALENLERFLHDGHGRTPSLLKAGLAYAQFASIHPFLDGNGRMGRLLVPLLLVDEGLLTAAVLLWSVHLDEHLDDHHRALQRVRTDGDWEGWLGFCFAAVEAGARRGAETALAAGRLHDADRAAVARLGRAADSTLRVHEDLWAAGMVSIARAADRVGFTWPTVRGALGRLEELGIAREVTGRARHRLYVHRAQLELGPGSPAGTGPSRTGAMPPGETHGPRS